MQACRAPLVAINVRKLTDCENNLRTISLLSPHSLHNKRTTTKKVFSRLHNQLIKEHLTQIGISSFSSLIIANSFRGCESL